MSLTVADRKVPHGEINVPVREYVPGLITEPEVIVWMHGGGWVMGDLDMPESDSVARALAASGRVVVAVDYRKVSALPVMMKQLPIRRTSNSYPAAGKDVLAVYEDTAARYPTSPIVLAGASAGANLAATVAGRPLSRPAAGLMLAFGAFHTQLPPMTPDIKSAIARAGNPKVFNAKDYRRAVLNYLGSPEIANIPGVFPGDGPRKGLPRTLFVNADADSLRASAERYADYLRAADVDVEESFVEGSTHGFLNEPKKPYFQEGIDRMVTWLNRE